MIYSRSEILEHLRAFGGAIGVHVLMAALVILGTMHWEPFRERQPVGLTIEAVIVDTAEIAKQRDEARRAQEMEERRQRREAQLEQQRQREAEERAQEQRRQQQLEEQRQREAQERLNQLRIQRERQQQEELERQKRQLEEVRRQREEAEMQRQREEERLKQLEAQRQREAQDELRRQQEAAEAQRRAEAEAQARAQEFKAGQMSGYEDAIRIAVTNNWLRPPTAQPGLRCTVKVIQIPGGEIISSSLVGNCNGDDVTRRSILAAVERTGTLPYRGFEDAFQREIEFIFLYNGD